ncbi:BrnA antitoxin family protein [Faucicola mancuniensis]|uniref:BrnA antitoxin family protein n=1 Tax=Faucicola mancuniensis TaxID=1309795 RepID=UPI003977D8B3
MKKNITGNNTLNFQNNLGNQTDWVRLAKMTDDEISYDKDNLFTTEDDWQGAVMKVGDKVIGHTRGKQLAPTKTPINIRLSKEVSDYFRSIGKGWQTRINAVLQEYVAKQMQENAHLK